MSEKHKDRIQASVKKLSTDRGQAYAFWCLSGIVSSMADAGQPVSVTRLAKAFESAVEYVIEEGLDK